MKYMKIKKVRIVFKQNREAKSTLLQLLNNIKKVGNGKFFLEKHHKQHMSIKFSIQFYYNIQFSKTTPFLGRENRFLLL